MEERFVVLTDKYIQNYKDKFCKGMHTNIKPYIEGFLLSGKELDVRCNGYVFVIYSYILRGKLINNFNMATIIALYEYFKKDYEGTHITIHKTDLNSPTKNVFLKIKK